MRLLISIILTSFFFLASHDSDAAGKSGFNGEKINLSQVVAKDLSNNSSLADAGLVAAAKFTLRNPSFQYRSLQGVSPDLVHLPYSAYEIVSPADRPTKSFSHCVPIGLKLLFPKHYFW